LVSSFFFDASIKRFSNPSRASIKRLSRNEPRDASGHNYNLCVNRTDFRSVSHYNLICSQSNNRCRTLRPIRNNYPKSFAVAATQVNDLFGDCSITARPVDYQIKTVNISDREKGISDGRNILRPDGGICRVRANESNNPGFRPFRFVMRFNFLQQVNALFSLSLK